MKKKLMAMALSLALTVTALPGTAFAENKIINYVEPNGTVASMPAEYTADNYTDVCRDNMPFGYQFNIRMDTEFNGDGIVCYVEKIVKPTDNLKVRLGAYGGGYDDVYLTWNKDNEATGYKVYSKCKNGNWVYLGKTTKTSYLKKDLKDGCRYDFKVLPYLSKDGEEVYTVKDGYSTRYTYTLKKLSAPTICRNGSNLKVCWNKALGNNGYQVSRSTSKTGTYIVTTTTGNTKVISSPKGLRYFKVRAFRNVTKNGKTVRVYAPWSDVRAYRK